MQTNIALLPQAFTDSNYIINNDTPRSAYGENTHYSRAHKETLSDHSTTQVDVPGTELALKANTHYRFEYDFAVTTSGALVTAQFAISFSGTTTNITYYLMQGSVAMGLATVVGTLIGQSTAILGAGPYYCRLVGHITVGANGGMLMLQTRGTGALVNVRIHADAVGRAEEL